MPIEPPGAGREPDRVDEAGFTVVSSIWVMAVTLVLVTLFANLFVQRYAQAVIRQATDEGARAWAVSGGSAGDCQAAADDVLADLLGGTVAEVTIRCADTGPTIVVTAQGTLRSIPPVPDVGFTTASVVTKELEDGDLVRP